MKKIFLSAGVVTAIVLLTNCNASKKLVAPPKMNYETNIKTLVMDNCVPCHVPAKGGFKKPYDNFTNLKTDIDEILHRIQLQPTEKGFMPFKRKRLSDSTINVFKQWKTDGLLEK